MAVGRGVCLGPGTHRALSLFAVRSGLTGAGAPDRGRNWGCLRALETGVGTEGEKEPVGSGGCKVTRGRARVGCAARQDASGPGTFTRLPLPGGGGHTHLLTV